MRVPFLHMPPLDPAPAHALLRFLSACLLVAAMGSGLSHAAPGAVDPDGQSQATGGPPTKTTSQLLSDLGSDNGPNRLYAARALKAQLTRALKLVEHARPGSLAGDEALSILDELDVRLPEQCMAALEHKNVVAPAAEMLMLLGEKDALPAITDAASKEGRKGVLKRLRAAESALLGLPAAEPAPMPGSAAIDHASHAIAAR
ncbi:MAG: hypothetical protein EXR69_12415 [Myxococcales bacterium]|nr:hypothetical protein [Myxococcales bacterium]